MGETKVGAEELVFGLDIGTRSIVGTVGYRQGERFVVLAQEIRQHETRAMFDGQIHDINRVSATISDIKQALQKKTGRELEEVCIAAAGRVLKTVNVHVDIDLDRERNVTKEDISNIISLGIENAIADFQESNDTDLHFYCVGHSVVRYFLNGKWMGQPEHHKAKNIGADIIATFLPDDVVDGLYCAVELAGLKVANMTLEPIAAIRVAIPEKFRLLNIAMIDVGAGTSDISITDEGSVIAFGMIPCAGDTLTELLAKTCLIDFATAEMIKTAATQQEEIAYEDIMGMKQTISAKEVVAICQPEIERMSKLAADMIRELNGGTSPSAVFIVGGGGKIKGFEELVAAELGLDEKRVALRGEEIMRYVEFPEGALKDSTIITPIGICLTYYEQYNNFIYVMFNGDRIKLYDNNKLTVTDAAMQADFTREGLFPRRGEALRYTVNGKNRVTKGEYGPSAHVYVNGEETNLSHSIKSNDVITLEEATPGAPAHETIADLVDYNGKIIVTVNGEEMQLPKPVKVNGEAVTEDYSIQNGDDIEVASSYTQEQFLEFVELVTEDIILLINGEKAESGADIHNADSIEIKNRKEYELEEIYKESYGGLGRESRWESRRGAAARRKDENVEAETETTESVNEDEAVTGSVKTEDVNAEAAEEAAETETAVPEETVPEEAVARADETPVAEASVEEKVAEEKITKKEESTDETAVEDTLPEETTVEETLPEETAVEETPTDDAAVVKTATEEAAAEKAPTETEKPQAVEKTVPEETVIIKETVTEKATAEKTPSEEKAAEVTKEAIKEATKEATKEAAKESKKEITKETPDSKKTAEEKEPEETGKKIMVIVNQKPIVMRGKQTYMFVDIFDYINFDTSRMRGSGIATLVNGKDAQYTQELCNGDKIEVYWK